MTDLLFCLGFCLLFAAYCFGLILAVCWCHNVREIVVLFAQSKRFD